MHLAKNKILYYQFLFFFLVSVFSVSGQDDFTQTIKGIVVDKNSQSSLPGANIILLNSDPLVGTVTDINGEFLINNVPIGRQGLKVSFVGFQTLELTNLIISSAKEFFIKVELEENIISTKEVTIIAKNQKDQPLNPMALVSARSFTVEETNKYAGSYGDPARMVANYAGVVSTRDNRNDIVIRGNSSMGLQYRLDGIEIANPNHFSALATTGGPVTVLNTNLLTNSDFLTGAFPAEYGNALAGVFDLKLRNGNTDKREYWAQLGFNGLEVGTEGPISKKSGSSYLAAYRYSFIDILERMGVNFKETAQYQDLTFKVNFPTKKMGSFSIFGIGGISKIKILDSKLDQNEWTFPTHGEDVNTGSSIGTFGVSNHYFINETTRLKTSISIVGSVVDTRIDTFSVSDTNHFLWAGERSSEIKYAISTSLSKKIDIKNSMSVGVFYDLYDINYADSSFHHGDYRIDTDTRKMFSLLRGYAQWQHKFSNLFETYLGLHYQYLFLNSTSSLEPRAGLKWNINTNQTINFGIGLHSQMQPRMMYFVQSVNPEGELNNMNMGLSKSLHLILGYNCLISEYLRFKAEAYYQYLYNIPVSKDIPQYSILNEGTEYYVDRQTNLVNKGTGNNYGIELTFEKFIHKNYFFLFTTSLFESDYKGYDGIKRSTSFNGNYVLNAVGGYELPLGKKKTRVLIFGLRFTWAGGRPYVPYDQNATREQHEVLYNWDDAYNQRYDDYTRASFRLGMRRNEKKFGIEFAIDLQYRANYTYVYLYRIDVVTGDIYKTYKMGFYPSGNWRINF